MTSQKDHNNNKKDKNECQERAHKTVVKSDYQEQMQLYHNILDPLLCAIQKMEASYGQTQLIKDGSNKKLYLDGIPKLIEEAGEIYDHIEQQASFLGHKIAAYELIDNLRDHYSDEGVACILELALKGEMS